MKVKPFCIKTKGLSKINIADAINKCIECGANAYEYEYVDGIHDGSDFLDVGMTVSNWVYFGVDLDNDTIFCDRITDYGNDAIEITLDQLDAHLGVDEWKNGDACQYWYWEGKEWRDSVYVTHDNGFHVVRDTEDNGYTGVLGSAIRKPETPQQREERERLEAIETMCNEVDKLPHGEAFAAMATLYDLGYRKQ